MPALPADAGEPRPDPALPEIAGVAAELVACDEVPGGVQARIRITVELEGVDEPACVVESLSRWLA